MDAQTLLQLFALIPGFSLLAWAKFASNNRIELGVGGRLTPALLGISLVIIAILDYLLKKYNLDGMFLMLILGIIQFVFGLVFSSNWYSMPRIAWIMVGLFCFLLATIGCGARNLP